MFQIPLLLRKKTQTEIFEMRQKGRFYYDKYFSSVEKIVLTSIRVSFKLCWSRRYVDFKNLYFVF